MTRQLVFVVITVSLIVFGCEKEVDHQDESILLNQEWHLFRFTGSSGIGVPTNITPATGEEYWLRFEEDGSVLVHDACNDCTSSYELQEDSLIVFSEMSCTEIACKGAQYLFLLDGLYEFSFINDTLNLLELHSLEGKRYALAKE